MWAEKLGAQLGRPSWSLGGWLVNRLFIKRNRVLEENAVALCNIEPGDTVLEVGHGPGLGLQAAASLLTDPKGRLIGVDYSEFMHNKAQKLLKEHISSGKVSLHQCDVAAMPLSDNSVDKVFHCNCYYFWPDLTKGAAELHRVMKPGALMVTTMRLASISYLASKQVMPKDNWRPEAYMAALRDSGFTHKTYVAVDVMNGIGAVFLLALLALGNATPLTTVTQIPRTNDEVLREAVTDGFIVDQQLLTTQAPQNQTTIQQRTVTEEQDEGSGFGETGEELSTTSSQPSTAEPNTQPSSVQPTTLSSDVQPPIPPSTAEPTTASSTAEPTAAPLPVEPIAASSTVEPTTSSSTVDPTAASSTVEPTAAPIPVDPTTSSSTAEPTAAPIPVDPTAASSTAEPTAASSTAEPTAASSTVEPTAAPIPVEPTEASSTSQSTSETFTSTPALPASSSSVMTESTTFSEFITDFDSGSGDEDTTTTTMDDSGETKEPLADTTTIMTTIEESIGQGESRMLNQNPEIGSVQPVVKETEPQQQENEAGKQSAHTTPAWVIIVGFLAGVAMLVLLCVAIATRDKWNGPKQIYKPGVTVTPADPQRAVEMVEFLDKKPPKENGKAEEYTVIPLDELPDDYSS
ncbi:hypothetical protein WMY93_013008 [Mugilogobius chulae]|uniref:Methyltransferase domain-containing protein n=1 Tax=Mugilogobius chulae TaxID=88201 RepID=A0AAW0P7W0_9GOBI